jgi:6-phosphofructokinase 1
VSIKYIDPSYIIRSVPANPRDSAFCLLLAHSAVHAGIRGRTNMVVGFWNQQFTHVLISLAASQRQKIDPEGTLWNGVLASPAKRGKCIESTQIEERRSPEMSKPSLLFLT